MKFRKSRYLNASIILIVAAMSGCGTQGDKISAQGLNNISDTMKPNDQTWNSFSVTSYSKLPACDASRVGALAWVTNEKRFYSCEDTGWNPAEFPTGSSHSVWSASSLPACEQSDRGSIAWVREEKTFYTCESAGWQKTENDGAKSYSVSNYSSLPTCDATRAGAHAWISDLKSFYTCESNGWAKAEVARPSTYSVSAVSSLPSCDSAIMGNIAWISGEKSFYTCNSTGWTKADTGMNESFSVAYASSLPQCTTSRLGAHAFVKNEGNLYTCEYSGWTVAALSQSSPLDITGRWTFHTGSLSGQPSITDEALYDLGYIGDIEVVRFSNDLAYFSISGIFITYTGYSYSSSVASHDHVYSEPFSFSGIIPQTSAEFVRIFKFSSYTNTRLRIRINFSTVVPTFKAVVDTDGNFADNTDKSITLTPAAF